ncbi:P-loop NTPase [Anaeromicropila populeti]|uniref:Iron-sulfur cluster carrier protein n=1 Tax=Anaeromicropila populeti TaxID=37658 RepID=A0A1I6IAQ0_9FIRM|nr:P-loop NTPase [Anaeromicropila populeti]SFR63748.1 Chromosome partitioning ATPase, Mrp family, contains Fe-S cluster [Anaeromicropila populeti]
MSEASENCSGSCGSCSEDCSSRQQSKEELYEPVNQYSKVNRVIGVVSGKGGVGKSFITSYLSVLLNRKGYETAILDADITGPSIPKTFGIHEKAKGNELGIFPCYSKNGIKVMSVNLLLEEEEMPVIWRGPIIAGTVKQFWTDVVWGNVEYMFVDMPPGTGDVPLTVFQSIPLDGIVIVTSPQDLVSMIVGKAVNMAKAMNVPIIGLVENYSYVSCGNCGEQIQVFGKSNINEVAEKYHIKVLGKLPLTPEISNAVDSENIEGLEGSWLDDAVALIEENYPGRIQSECGCKTMQNQRIAVTVDEEGNIYQHFGSCERFAIYDIENGVQKSKSIIETNSKGHDEISRLLVEQDATTLICGGIGESAMKILMSNQIVIVPGQQGDADVQVAAYLDGATIASSSPTCGNHDGEEGCGCGCNCSCH